MRYLSLFLLMISGFLYAQGVGQDFTPELGLTSLADTSAAIRADFPIDTRIYADVTLFGAKGDGSDATAAFAAAIATGKNVYVPTGSYLISSTLSLADKQTMLGDGPKSILLTTADISIVEIGIGTTIKSVHFKGDYVMDLTGGIEVPAGQHTASPTKPSQRGVYASRLIRDNYTWSILECRFTNLRVGVEVYDNGDTALKNKGGILTSCVFQENNVGLLLGYRTEYTSTSNCIFWGNGIGYYNGGGNNVATGGSYTRNGIAYYLTDAKNTSGTPSGNPAHGSFANAAVNHNRMAIRVDGVNVSTIGHRFTNLDIYQTTVAGNPADTLIKITGSERIFFSGCSMGKGWISTDNNSSDIYFRFCDFMHGVNTDFANDEVYTFGSYAGATASIFGEENALPKGSDADGDYILKKITDGNGNTIYDWVISGTASAWEVPSASTTLDFNTVEDGGIHPVIIRGTAPNGPGPNINFFVETFSYDNGTLKRQVARSTSTYVATYERIYFSSAWGAWQKSFDQTDPSGVPTLEEVISEGATATTKPTFSGGADFGTTNLVTVSNGKINYNNAAALLDNEFNNGTLAIRTNVSGTMTQTVTVGAGKVSITGALGVNRAARAGRSIDATGGYIDANLNQVRNVGAATVSADAMTLGQFQVIIKTGSGSPESSVTASPGTLYLNTAGGANTTLYVKETGTGNTGWVAK